eukprot:5890840-Pleurochrysis_carterae.AAC.1
MSACMRRPAYEGEYSSPVCGSLGELASVQAAQPSSLPVESDEGASAVSCGSCLRREAPTCRRRCRQMVASRGDMTLT